MKVGLTGRNDVTYNFSVDDFHTYYVTEFGVLVHNIGPCNFGSLISTNPKLVKEAQKAARSNQVGLDKLKEQLITGNLNPGIGTKSLGSGISYARGSDGARLFFRKTGNGIEILGKSNKANEQTVINEVLKTFGN